MAKPIMRIEAIKSINALTTRYRHNTREEQEKNGHINEALTKNNVEFIKPPENTKGAASFFKKRIAELPYYDDHKIRKNAVLAHEVVLSYGVNELPKDFSVSQWASECERFLLDTYGKENIISAVVHMDESVPHIHALCMPITDGKLSAYATIGDRNALRELHERFYDGYMSKLGLEREDTGKASVVRENMTTFHKALDKVFAESLPERKAEEGEKEYYDRVNEIYRDVRLKNFELEHDNKLLKRDLTAFKKDKKHKETELKKDYEESLAINKRTFEREMTEIIDSIGGSLEAAIDAVSFKEHFDAALEYALDTSPETAEDIKENMDEMLARYDEHIEEIEKEERKEEDSR